MDDGYYHGINKLKKPATKVMAPPGGATHINVFAESAPEAPKPVNKCQEERSKSSVFAGPDDMNPSRSPATTAAPARQTSTSSHEDKADKHTSTKVLAPPGGKSNFSIFGGSAEEAKPPANHARQPPAAATSQNLFGGGNDNKAAPAKKQPAESSGNSLFGGGNEEVIGQRARNRKPPGGESHNIFG